jgi:hypothetical protein
MDLVGACSSCQQAGVMAQVQLAVAKKIMNTQKTEGQAMVGLIEAATKGVSDAGDQLAAASIGLGGLVDVKA